MKNTSLLLVVGALCCLAAGCSTSESSCDKNVSISAVLPNSNPTGYEVLLKTSGFTSAAKVVFGTVAASSRAGGSAGEIIATVPAGLSGNVEISVEEGDCIARSGGFVVLAALPGNVQPSLPNIIIPTPPVTYPQNDIQNNWANAASIVTGRSYGIHFIGFIGNVSPGVCELDPTSYEFDFDNNSLFSGNPVKGNINTNTNVVYVEIDRTAKGGTVEKFDGQFIGVPPFLLNIEKWPILLTSRETGRQLIVSFPE